MTILNQIQTTLSPFMSQNSNTEIIIGVKNEPERTRRPKKTKKIGF